MHSRTVSCLLSRPTLFSDHASFPSSDSTTPYRHTPLDIDDWAGYERLYNKLLSRLTWPSITYCETERGMVFRGLNERGSRKVTPDTCPPVDCKANTGSLRRRARSESLKGMKLELDHSSQLFIRLARKGPQGLSRRKETISH